MRSRAVVACVLVGSVLVLGVGPAAARCPSYAPPVRSGRVNDDRINEASGLVGARGFHRTYWLHEDSGNGAWVYAVSTRGRIRSAIDVRDAINRDWEDIARGMGRIWIGDIGANALNRHFVRVYWFAEPTSLSTRHVRANVIVLRYPDGESHNAEAMIVDTRSRRLFVFEKQTATRRSGVFGAGVRGVRSGDHVRLRRVARVPMQNITAADIGAPGIVVKNNGGGLLFPWAGRRVGSTLRRHRPCGVDLPSGEAVAFSGSGARIYTVPEGSTPPIDYVEGT
jgi:hypothetical protein